MHLKTPDGQPAVVVGGSVPAVRDGWMWDLTVPGNNDHDFYVLPEESGSGSTYHHVDEHGVTAVLVHNVNEVCDVATLKAYARQIRMSGNDDIAISSRVIAVGQDDAGNLTAGSSNRFDTGMQAAADNLGIRIVPNVNGMHAEEELMQDNQGTLWPLRRVASDNQGACGPEIHDCAGQMDRLGIEHN